MSSLTRILNNQITNSTIVASQKIAAGTITGSLFASNVTVPGDFLVTGNLFVLGTSAYTTIASTNTYVNDPLIVLNNGFAGTNTYDEGLIFNRGSLQNRALIWSEFNQEFRLIGTTETGTAYGNVTVSNYQNLHLGNLTVDYTANVTNLNATGFINTLGNISAAVGVFESINSTGFINTSANISAAVGLFGAINSTGYINTTGNISTAQLNAGQINTTGNVLASTVRASFLTASTAAVGNISAVTIGNTGAVVQGLTAQFDGNVIGGLAQFAAINSTPIGNATASTGTFTVLAANNNLWANASIATTTQGTGAIVVPNGGISVSGAANIEGAITTAGAAQFNNTITVGGISAFTNTTNATDSSGSTGALRIAGGTSIAKDLWVGGNIYASNIFGVTHQVITVQDPLVYFDAANTYPYNYDIGFYSNFVGPNPIDNTGNVYQHSGLVRDNDDNTWKFFSNVRSEPAGTAITFDSDTIFDPIRAGNLTLTYTQEATSATTGSFKTAGGAGIGGNIFQTGTQLQTSASNYIFATTPTTVDAFKAATTLNIGATSGTATIQNPTLVGTQATQDLYNTVASTINFGRAANITMGHTDGITTLQGNANVRAVTGSTSFTSGALVVAGGAGIAGNLNVKLGQQITIGIEHPNANVAFPERQIVAIGNINAAAGMNLRNMSTGDTASTNYIAVADNNVSESNFVNMGIAGSAFTEANTKIKANDGYIQIAGGNLHIGGSTGKDVTISSTLLDTDIGIIVSSNHANVSVQKTTDTTSSTTGAFTVVGGVGIGKKLAVGKGAEFNTLNSTDTFRINSSVSGNVALFANVATTLATSTEYVVIGGGNTVVQPGVTLKVGSISTMMLPVGPTAARPSNLFGNVLYDVPGMIRFNNTINNMEFYDGTQWQVTGSTFTVISGRQFSGNVAGGFGNVDGTNTTFTLQATATTASTIISINGVMQFPTLAYSVTGDQLEFTEPPAPNDVIDARILTTTSTVESIASGNGLNQFIADDAGAQIWTGTASTIKRLDVDTGGNINIYTGSKITYNQTPTQVINTNLTLLDRFSANTYTTAKYVISMKQDTGNVQAMEALLTQSTVGSTAGTAYVTTYGVVNTGNTMGTLAANVDVSSGWVVNLWLIPNAGTAISNVKVMTNYIV